LNNWQKPTGNSRNLQGPGQRPTNYIMQGPENQNICDCGISAVGSAHKCDICGKKCMPSVEWVYEKM